MTEGFILDHGDSGSLTIAKWQGGQPKKSIWTGIKAGEPQIDVCTYRCNRCGYLESFAS